MGGGKASTTTKDVEKQYRQGSREANQLYNRAGKSYDPFNTVVTPSNIPTDPWKRIGMMARDAVRVKQGLPPLMRGATMAPAGTSGGGMVAAPIANPVQYQNVNPQGMGNAAFLPSVASGGVAVSNPQGGVSQRVKK